MIEDRFQIISMVLTAGMLFFVFELIRRRKLMERYSLLWLACGIVLLVLAVWRGLLTGIAEALGIHSPVNALFAVAVGFVLLLLLHFSTIISRLADQNKILAQKAALLENELDSVRSEREEVPAGPGSSEAPPS